AQCASEGQVRAHPLCGSAWHAGQPFWAVRRCRRPGRAVLHSRFPTGAPPLDRSTRRGREKIPISTLARRVRTNRRLESIVIPANCALLDEVRSKTGNLAILSGKRRRGDRFMLERGLLDCQQNGHLCCTKRVLQGSDRILHGGRFHGEVHTSPKPERGYLP